MPESLKTNKKEMPCSKNCQFEQKPVEESV